MVLAQVVRLDMHIEYVLNSNLPNIYKKKQSKIIFGIMRLFLDIRMVYKIV